jgi:hypothetical protein
MLGLHSSMSFFQRLSDWATVYVEPVGAAQLPHARSYEALVSLVFIVDAYSPLHKN